MYCTSCGNQLRDAARFCGKCGTPVPAASIQEEMPPAPSPVITPVRQASNLSADSSEVITDNSAVIKTITAALENFSELYRDIADGNDITRWANMFLEVFLVYLVGEMISENPMSVAPETLRAADAVDLIVPCFFDSNPLPHSQAGEKVKFNGEYSEGYLIFTGNEIISIYIEKSGKQLTENCVVRRKPLSSITEYCEMKFKLSKLSMTSSEKGYEILFDDHRLLFRIAVMERYCTKFYDETFPGRLLGKLIPLFKGFECAKWVEPDSASDPKDETGTLRHYPYDS